MPRAMAPEVTITTFCRAACSDATSAHRRSSDSRRTTPRSSATMLEPSFTTATLTWRRLWAAEAAGAQPKTAKPTGMAAISAAKPVKRMVRERTVMAATLCACAPPSSAAGTAIRGAVNRRPNVPARLPRLDCGAYLHLCGGLAEAREAPGRAGRLPGGGVGARAALATTSKAPRSPPRSSRTSATSSASWSGSSSSIGKRPSQRAARRNGRRLRPARRHPHRRARALNRQRLELPVPELRQPLQALVEQPGPFARVRDLAERLELAVAVAPEARRRRPAARRSGGRAWRSRAPPSAPAAETAA